MKHSKHPVSARVEEDIYRRLEIVSLVDRRSVADIVAECVRRALPALEAELQQPRLTPQMAADLKAGKLMSEVIPSPYGHAAPRPPEPRAAVDHKRKAA